MYEDWLPIEGANARMGGQGTVTKVRHKVDGRVGARKKLHQRLLHDKERRRMVREVLALQEVQGESIPRVLDHNMESVSQTGAPLFFVSEGSTGRPYSNMSATDLVP